jgi:hypothetical protein
MAGPESEVITARAKTVNLSQNGACIRIDDLPPESVPAVLKRFQKCSAVFRVHEAATPLHISGDIVWVEILGEEDRPRTRFGMQLTETDREERERLAKVLEHAVGRYGT